MNRRQFLGTLSAALVSAPAWPQLEKTASPKHVLILGAGLAGLMAGYELSNAGHDITILEARSFPGGRVQTFRQPFADGLYADAGAARVASTHDLTIKYAKLFGLQLDPFFPPDLDPITYMRGKRIVLSSAKPEFPLNLTPEEKELGQGGLFKKYVIPVLKEVGNPLDPNWPPASIKKYDAVNFVEFVRQRGASPAVAELLTFTAPYNEMSALYMLRMMALDQASTGFTKIRGGNDLLPKAFAAKLAGKIRYGSPVVRIHQTPRNVEVTFLAAGSPQTLTADRVVCAIPFPPLRRIQITPEVSPGKRQAIEKLHYLAVTRVFLQSRTRFWTAQGLNGFGSTDDPSQLWHPTWDQPGPRGLLISYQFGAFAKRTAAMSESERMSFTLTEMDKVFPGLRENYEGGVSKSWDNDQWAMGAGAEMGPEQITTLLPHVATPEGRIHFAGEHTSHWNAWMQGALESGLRVAREVHQAA